MGDLVLVPFFNGASSKWIGDLLDAEDEGDVILDLGTVNLDLRVLGVVLDLGFSNISLVSAVFISIDSV